MLRHRGGMDRPAPAQPVRVMVQILFSPPRNQKHQKGAAVDAHAPKAVKTVTRKAGATVLEALMAAGEQERRKIA